MAAIAIVRVPGDKESCQLDRTGRKGSVLWTCGCGGYRVRRQGAVCVHMEAIFNGTVKGAEIEVLDTPRARR